MRPKRKSSNWQNGFDIKRRQFAFWIGMCRFWFAENLGVDVIDRLAAATMRANTPSRPKPRIDRWTAGENRIWQWYARETLIEGTWTSSGITTPVNKETGQAWLSQRKPGARKYTVR